MKIDRCYVAYVFANEMNTLWGAVQCGAIKRNMNKKTERK